MAKKRIRHFTPEQKARRREASRRWYQKNKGKLPPVDKAKKKLRAAQYYQREKDRLREVRRAWREKNRDKLRRQARERRLKNPNVHKAIHFRKRYGLSLADLAAMRHRQADACLLCLSLFGHSTPCVDHDHVTGTVRGLLCRDCNLDLHTLETRPADWLARATAYLAQGLR